MSTDTCRHLWEYDEDLCRVECPCCGSYVAAGPGYHQLFSALKAEALENAERRVLPPRRGTLDSPEERQNRRCRQAVLFLERTERERGRAS
jgi:hypothetical protein